MKIIIISLCLLAVVYCQTSNKNGNPTGEIGQPAFDEIVVESTLTVRGKSGSRSGKSLVTQPKEPTLPEPKIETSDGASISLKRSKRVARFVKMGNQNIGPFPQQSFEYNFPCFSSSAAQASSNAFNCKTPFGNFGASASQSSSQSQSVGPNGFQSSAGHSSSQSYLLPNGGKISITLSQFVWD